MAKLIFNYRCKSSAMIPNSVVRESEYATAENTGSVPQKVWARYNKMLEGERLAPEQRANFLRTSKNLFRQAAP